MKKTFVLLLIILIIGTINISCSEKAEFFDTAYTPAKSISGMSYGELHNAFLDNAIALFDDSIAFDSVLQIVDYIVDINNNFADCLSIGADTIESLKDDCEQFGWFVSLPDFYDSIFGSGNYNIYDAISILNSLSLITNTDKDNFTAIANAINAVYTGSISHTSAISTITYLVENASLNPGTTTAAVIYDIALESIEFWGDPNNEEIPFGDYPAYVPPQVAADIGGAIVGAGINAATQYIENGSVNGYGVAKSAAIGAVSASIGAPMKVGKAVCKAAAKAGKFIKKLIK